MEKVLSYFLRYPMAADTLEGIVHWRLQEETVHRTVEETKRAVDWLLAQGFLVQQASTPPIYRLNPDMREQSTNFLDERRS